MRTVENSESVAIGSRDENSPQVVAPGPAHTGRTHWTRKVVVVLCFCAALRILVFAAAFPLFNNLDEKFHFLTIQMYARGQLPGRDLPAVGREAAKAMLLYSSQEYDHSREDMDRQGIGGPLCRLSPAARESAFTQGYYAWKLEALAQTRNFEAQADPFYYVLAAGWYDLGTVLGIRDWRLAYWVRLLNPIAYGLFVWLSYRFVLKVYPDRPFLSLAVPALIAVFPLDVFFGINRDVLSPTLAAGALLLMADAITSFRPRFLVWASVLVGLAFVTEVSNCVLYLVLISTLWIWLRRSRASPRRKVRVVCASTFAALLLPSLWMWRNYLVIGDLTGSKAKAQNFGWTPKPLSEIFHHPLFSLDGLAYFFVKLAQNLWQGEYFWHGMRLASNGADWLYFGSSVLLIGLFLLEYLRRRRSMSNLQKWAGLQSLLLFISSVIFLALISLLFDYHDFYYPSRLHPYFVSGRIISGTLLPFILMYAIGLEFVTNGMRRYIPPLAVLTCMLLFISISQMRVRSVVFSSPYNFFALSGWRH